MLLTVDMECDFSSAAVSDRITKTIDYYAVAQELLKFGEGRSWKLIEKIATDVAELVLNRFRPRACDGAGEKVSDSASPSRFRQCPASGGGTVKRAGWGIP